MSSRLVAAFIILFCFFGVGWLLCVCFADVLFVYRSAGCWITDDPAGLYWRIFQFYFFLWGVFIVDIVLYAVVPPHRQSMEQFGGTGISTNVRRMAAYPFALLLAYSWATVNHTKLGCARTALFWLYVLHVAFAALMGMFNGIAYATTPAIVHAVQLEMQQLRFKVSVLLHNAPATVPVPRYRRMKSVHWMRLTARPANNKTH